MTMHEEGHVLLCLASDTSGLGWGRALLNSDGKISMPQAMGVNLFTQDIAQLKGSVFESCYVFPPFLLIGSVLKFLREWKARCTIVVLDRYPRPY